MTTMAYMAANISWALLGAVTLIILVLLLLAWRNPVLFKVGLRNIPRRPAQSILIVVGLTLSTVIIVASFATGDTLNYSVQRQAVAAYGTIDEIIAPPLLSAFTAMGAGVETEQSAQAQEQLTNLTEGGLTTVLTVLEGGLPGISMDRLARLKEEASQEPLIDGVAGSILFPTIIRNSSTGQGEPIGFIFAVDNDYDQSFGITSIDGRALEIESLQPGVGNIFVQASNLFGMVGDLGARMGLDLSISNVATAVAAVGAVISGSGQGDLATTTIDLATLQELGIDTQLLEDAGITEINVGELVQAIPGLSDLLGGTAITGTLPLTGTAPAAAAAPLTVTAGATPVTGTALAAAATPAITASTALTGGETVTATATQTATPGLLQNLATQAGDLLGSFNLNTLGSELDRVLGQVGLQLRQGDVYLNRLGAEQLGAQVGDVLEVFIGPIPIPLRVKAVVEEASPVGALFPTVVMRLDEAQKLLFMDGKVNNVLVSNQGDMLTGVEHTTEVSGRLRMLAMESDVVDETVAILKRPAVRRAIETAAANPAESVMGEDVPPVLAGFLENFVPDLNLIMQQVQDVSAALDDPGVTPELRRALANTEIRSWLLGLNLSGADRDDLAAAMGNLNQFDVLDPLSKQSVLSVSDVAGTIFSSLFSVFGFFSVLAGIILIFLIFVMLAAERRSEMGISRAIGVQRRHLVQMFVSEGIVYSLAAAALGLLIGLGVSFVMIEYLGSIINQAAGQFSNTSAGILDFAFHVSWRSIIISYCLGVLLTFVIVTVSSWRVSRLNIVAAIRDLPDESNARRRSIAGRVWLWLWPLLLLALGVYVLFYGNRWELWSVVLIGITLGLFGIMLLVDRVLESLRIREETANRIVYTIIGFGLLALWIVPWQRVLPQMGLERFTGDPTQILAVFAIGGPMIITGAIMVIMFNATVFTWIIERLFGWISSLTPVLKTAIAYPLSSRFRTGTAMVLFAMIMATVVVMALVIQATQSLITLTDRESGGFDVQTSNTLLSFFDPVVNIDDEIARARAGYPLLDQIERAGSMGETSLAAQVESPEAFSARAQVTGLTDGFIAQAAQVYPFARRAAGYADDAAIWEALRTRDDVVVVRSGIIALPDEEPRTDWRGPDPDEPDPDEIIIGDEGQVSGPPLRLYGIDPAAEPFPDVFITLSRDDNGVTRAQRVRVIGVLEEGEMLASGNIQANMRLLDTLLGEPAPRNNHYMTVKEGADPRAVAQEVERAFLSSGINATVMTDQFAQTQAFTRNILRLLQGFMALGLLVGIAGLGVITTRTVVERRQQVGMLRALGYQARMVGLSFVLEASFIAITGILIGAATGIVLGLNIVGVAFGAASSAIGTVVEYQLPWGSIALVLLLAYGFALLTTIIPAWQASRIYPAEALRYE